MTDLDQLLPQGSEADVFLQGIQGNIINGHGRDHTRHILLKMTGDRRAVKRWISEFAVQHVTSAAAARRQTLSWRAQGGSGEPFAMFLLSVHGYRYLDAQPPNPGGPFTRAVDKEYFLRGMKRQAEISTLDPPGRSYNDPPSSQWESVYDQDIDAMVLLANDNSDRLQESQEQVLRSIPGVFEKLTIESGNAIRKGFPHPHGAVGELSTKVVEHFGFQDGVSQPIMIPEKLERELRERGNTFWKNPAAPLSLAFVQEPRQVESYGSFMVFRKLEQDVKAFWDALAELSSASNVSLEKAGAMAVGRFRDGTPLIPSLTPDPEADPNDFHYGRQDHDGARCPFHAHIRKTNPRGDLPDSELEQAKRIVRRGITYDDRRDGDSSIAMPSKGVGLLFMCFQANLDQFVIQQEGSDGNDFARMGTGFDAVIGQYHGTGPEPVEQTWPSTGDVKFKMVNFVRMRGGEYFFAPSMTFLKGLSQV